MYNQGIKEVNGMCEWNESTEAMIDWIENNLSESPTLTAMSKHIGYSPYYCSAQFHRIVGMTIKAYVAGRRLCRATIDIRDTDERILDIAVKYGYSSQEALTRAFVSAYGCTPAAYRKYPRPVALSVRQTVLSPYDYINDKEGERRMSEFCLKEPQLRIEHIPAHKYIGIWEDRASGYGDFWDYHNCDEVCGIIESMRNDSEPVVGCHMAGWFYVDGERRYFYGLGVPVDYSGKVPEGFSVKEFPASYYAVFFPPAFDYLKDNCEVMSRVENMAWSYDISTLGMTDANLSYNDTRKLYRWNEEECQCYQRHYPAVLGYEVLRPIKRV